MEISDEAPLRAELFSADQMEQHGRALAKAHVLSRSVTSNRLLDRLDDNEKILIETCKILANAVKKKLRIAPAGEWVLDNFYLIEEQIRTARKHLPKSYSRELPRLGDGPSAGLPRVYDIALEGISHGDGRLDAETLRRFVAAYQTITPLQLGELWAIPIMLRLAMIENLRRVSARLSTARTQLNLAQAWTDKMMEIAESDPKSLILVIADMARSDPPMVSPFVAELSRRLQGHGPALALPLTWIEQRLAESSQTIEQLVLAENQQQAADQVSIGNTIGSLRSLGATDWRVFVETMSVVEEILLKDSSGTYGSMDAATRDRYRRVVDRLAKCSDKSEAEVAWAAITLAQQNSIGDHSDPKAHVGFFLIDGGLRQLEKAVHARRTATERVRQAINQSPLSLYLGSIAIVTLGLTTGLLLLAYQDGVNDWRLPVLAALLLASNSQFASAISNWLTTLLMAPKLLPRMDFSLGIPATDRTLVVIPTMLGAAYDIDDLLEALEVRFLGNRHNNLHFGLLTDFCDAADETLAEDALLLQLAQSGIAHLNKKYSTSGDEKFFLFHRPRRWHALEKIWMGYERKRGKLADLNAALRGAGWHKFSCIVGDVAALSKVRYVITLDTDTKLPRDTAQQLAGVMAHPLNRPHYDEAVGRVTRGYGILQPRISASWSGSTRSLYARLCGTEPGIDPYTRSVSDVYQDLFGEGSFTGKGIYDIDAFELALKDRLPENKILSHDLLEGCYARSGLLSDIDLVEEYPATYEADVSRQRRWIRGDWQIACWLLPRVPGLSKQSLRNPLSPLSRWKILDNLRRSLATIALPVLLLMGWLALPQPWIWTLTVIGIVLIPALLALLVDAFRKPREMMLGQHLRHTVRSSGQNILQVGFRIACLPYEAWFNLDAVLRTTWRMMISHRRLLEWSVSGGLSYRDKTKAISTYRQMWAAPSFAVVTILLLAAIQLSAWIIALPVIFLWLTAPGVAWWLSRGLVHKEVKLSSDQSIFLRKIARKTWSFFERFVADEDNWLPPDNFQERPHPVIAHRTSPTNIGMALLANLSAYDFGYISSGLLIQRTVNTFNTLSRLERHQGHFYNWYDTLTLQPLPPRYISSVDSGNLAGHLLTLHAGLLALPAHNIVSTRLFEGLADVLAILLDNFPEPGSPGSGREPIANLQMQVAAASAEPRMTLQDIFIRLSSLVSRVAGIHESLGPTAGAVATDWLNAFEQQCEEALGEIKHFAPWVAFPTAPVGLEALSKTTGTLTLSEIEAHAIDVLQSIDAHLQENPDPTAAAWLLGMREMMVASSACVAERIALIERVAAQAIDFATMEYGFLYDHTRHLLAIGYNVDNLRRDDGFYDLLASEARLCNFVAIAQGKLPQESWFSLGRLLVSGGGEPILMSWSGSMFEYLMPLLVMPSYEGTSLDQTYRAVVARQIAYGNQRSLPWGVSESGYNTVDASLNYQYHAFGVPGLGLKRGLAEEQVVTPYASALALMVAPEQACENLQRLSVIGVEGRFGFFEAIDYTPSRLERAQTSAVAYSFMAHHQGMVLVSLANLILDRSMQRRFESAPLFQATLLLLQERVPKASVALARIAEHSEGSVFSDAPQASTRAPLGSQTATPEVQLLSNGRYHVMLTNAGGGYSRWKDLGVTRWREDSTSDNWGTFIYLRDISSGEYWSAAHQPVLKRADSYEAMFSEGRAEYRRRDHDYDTYSEIVVSPEDDIELRRLRVTNRSRTRRTIEITSYAEVVMAPPSADMTQTSFSNLFVQTEIVGDRRAILCTRRPRSDGDPTPWMFHLLAAHGTEVQSVSYETDRMRFIGRNRTVAAPQAMNHSAALSGTSGSVLDPVVAIRCRLTLDPEQSATLDLVSGAADSRDSCIALVDKYHDRHLADRVFDLAWTHSGVALRQINVGTTDAQLYTRMAGSILYANAALRAESNLLVQNRRGQSGLWGYAISGDLPILLLKIADIANIDLARQLIQCHAYWRMKGLTVDLVIWNEDHVGYRQQLQDQIIDLIATGSEAQFIDRPGGIFVRSAEQISHEDRILLQAVARVIIADDRGTLEEQVDRRSLTSPRLARLVTTRRHRPESVTLEQPPRGDLILGNGIGGYSQDGSEYVITTTSAQMTPVPWVNVLANPNFGTVISESGSAYSWSENAHEFRLTPWSDDVVGAAGGEAFYLRDEESGHFWSPTPMPVRGTAPYVSRHGFGYSVFEHLSDGIRSELWVYVDLQDSVKFSVLKIHNESGRTRKLSATGYIEWVLGDLRPKTAMHVVTEIDSTSGALFARNAYNTEFSGRTAFFDVDDISRTLTGDRTEFLGRNGALGKPDAMKRAQLSGRLGAGLDPCGAIQVPFELLNGQDREIIFRMGAGQDIEQTRKLVQRLRKAGSARSSLENVRNYWRHTLSAVQIETPDASLNVLSNGWLLYQVLACRVWARSGYYQSGGAFGFRDQLQDVMALVHAEPQLAREHLLRCAARQFPEGDVQHWWHPPAGRGVRTRCSDDFLWLPLATCRYIAITGDIDILDEKTHFLSGRLLGAEEESYYDLPGRSSEQVSLYQHCVKGIENGLKVGVHGLPLMGSGDWNDGMNLVGIHGTGESVWLGFFLYEVLRSFATLARQYGDMSFAERCDQHAARLQDSAEKHAWDGGWYRRAWFDDGTPLGSAVNPECQIDSIAQSWSVLSGAGDLKRTRIAMDALDKRLVNRKAGLVQLLDPPFDQSKMNPGYIKGYVPGVRENGGHYTHAAVWAAMAFAVLGESRQAWELLELINPINHGLTPEAVETYKTEPYVLAADVYAVSPHTGRGGWTWYTGSAGWLYRLITESLLGLKVNGDQLSFLPCVPDSWAGYSLNYRYRQTRYQIKLSQSQDQSDSSASTVVTLDGLAQGSGVIQMVDDRRQHQIDVVIRRSGAKTSSKDSALARIV